jgi:sterol desaturase/sphingolipid hydroxylase (fatty acid hydroxylase superfamily)
MSVAEQVLLALALMFGIQVIYSGLPKFNRSFLVDLAFFAINVLRLAPFLIFFGSFGAALGVVALQDLIGPHGVRVSSTGSAVLDFVLSYALYSFCFYWNHRLFHTKFGWHVHRFHHSAEQFSPLVTYREHPLQSALNPIVLQFPFALLIFPVKTVIAVNTFHLIHSAFVHLDVPWRLGWVGRWVLMSPVGHRLHHSVELEDAGKNLSMVPLWDRLFGTWSGKSYVGSVGVTGPSWFEKTYKSLTP